MTCEEVELVMIDYLDNVLDNSHRESIEKHIMSCERCSDEVAEFKSILQSISATEMEKPDETLKMNFYHMLYSEMNKINQGQEQEKTIKSHKLLPSILLKIAAGIALLISGAFLGNLIHKNIAKNNTLVQVESQKREANYNDKMQILVNLNEASPSQRIKAVSLIESSDSSDSKVLNALISVLNKDNNVNVRLAAAYSLSKFLNNKSVRDSMVESLGKQKEPILQIALMNLLTEKNETNAIAPMKKIISNKNTMEQVKYAAQKSIEVLL